MTTPSSTLTTKHLQARLADLGHPTSSRNRPWLIKRLTAAEAEAASSDQAGETVPITNPASLIVGTKLRRTWRDQTIVVTVTDQGFRLRGVTYASLSAAATALCGSNRNGLVFFGLKPRPTRSAGGAA